MRWLGVMGGAVVAAGLGFVLWGERGADVARPPEGASVIPAAPVVEVLNGTGRPGLARSVTHDLRRHGIDVVYYGNAPEMLDSTVVLVRRGDVSNGHRVREVLGAGRVEPAPDARRAVDVSVVLGEDFPLPSGFHP